MLLLKDTTAAAVTREAVEECSCYRVNELLSLQTAKILLFLMAGVTEQIVFYFQMYCFCFCLGEDI